MFDIKEHIDCACTNKKNQKLFNEKLPLPEQLIEVAQLYKVFGEPTRIKILYILFDGEACVCDIAEVAQMTQSAISHQLRVLKSAKLVKYRREGKSIIYSLADDHVKTILAQGMEHIME